LRHEEVNSESHRPPGPARLHIIEALALRITPLDVQSHRFSRRWQGYDSEEVDAFLRMIAEDYESLLRERETLADQASRLEARVEELSAKEQLLQDTLLSAQAMSEDLRHTAVREAEVLLSEAEVKAEKIVDAAHRRSARLSEDIREMRGLRSRMASALRSCIQTHLSLIETLETDPEEPGASADGKVIDMPRGPGGAGPKAPPVSGDDSGRASGGGT
jgi:cell division initiation protein